MLEHKRHCIPIACYNEYILKYIVIKWHAYVLLYYQQMQTDKYSDNAKTKIKWLVLYLAEWATATKTMEPRHVFIAIYDIPKYAKVNSVLWGS